MGNINTIYTKSFQAFVDMLPQQKDSRTGGKISEEHGIVGEVYFADFINSTGRPNLVTTANEDTPINNQAFNRRKITMNKFDWGWLFDELNKIQMLSDPTSEVLESAKSSFNREKDIRAFDAMIGTAYSGKSGTTSVPLPDANKSSATGGMSVDKLRLAKMFLDNQDIPIDEERFCALTGTQLYELLQAEVVTSADYNSIKALVNGQVDTFLGFKFVNVSQSVLPTNTAGTLRYCPVWTKSAVRMAYGIDITSWVKENVNKKGNPHAYCKMHMGASRMHEQGVYLIQCVES